MSIYSIRNCVGCFFVVSTVLLGGFSLWMRWLGETLTARTNHEEIATRCLYVHGFSADTVNALLRGTSLGQEERARLFALKNDSVFYLLSRNPSLNVRERAALISNSVKSKIPYELLSGVAVNPGLTRDEIETFIESPKEIVPLQCLASNAGVPEDLLVRLYQRMIKEDVPGTLSWFASNSNCPASIVKVIEASKDEEVLLQLQHTRDAQRAPWLNENGIYYDPRSL